MIVTLHNGTTVDLRNPKLELDIETIALQLDRINRFSGASKRPYSVMEHSYRGALWAKGHFGVETGRAFLLHDAHEIIIGDITTPVAEFLDIKPWLTDIKIKLDRQIEKIFGVKLRDANGVQLPDLHITDMTMLRREWDDLMPTDWPGEPWGSMVGPAKIGHRAPTPVEFVNLWDWTMK
jgi:uncharacterized protein